jgi:hypothetical protein
MEDTFFSAAYRTISKMDHISVQIIPLKNRKK